MIESKAMDQSQLQEIQNRLSDAINSYLVSQTKARELFKSIYIISSLARGDYRPGLSDKDLLIFFPDNIDRREQQTMVKDLESNVTREAPEFNSLDILYLNRQELPLTLKQQLASPVSKFSIFGFDLKENHLLIHGSDILTEFQPQLDPFKYVDRYLDLYLQQAKEVDSLSRLILTTCQIIRCLFLKERVITLHKEELLKALPVLPYKPAVKSYIKDHPHFSGQLPDHDHFRRQTAHFLDVI